MKKRPLIGKLVVVGVGLIGGSLARALKSAGAVGQVVGVGRRRTNLDTALALGIVDRALTTDEAWIREAADADVVLLATPVAQFHGLFAALAPAAGAHTVITDAGSTKQDVIQAARITLGDALPRFVPAHPIAGSDETGAAAASDALFVGRPVVLTPLAETAPGAVKLVSAMWSVCGATITQLAPARHDRILAAVSHLPHMLAFLLVAELASRADAAELFAHAGSGFRDFTRIAASSPEIWRDIVLANRTALLEELDDFRAALDAMRDRVEDGDGNALERLFKRSSKARRRWEMAGDSPRREPKP